LSAGKKWTADVDPFANNKNTDIPHGGVADKVPALATASAVIDESWLTRSMHKVKRHFQVRLNVLKVLFYDYR
jgi:hypothetical protein